MLYSPLTTALSPGALETPLCVKKEGGEQKRELVWASLISQTLDKANLPGGRKHKEEGRVK